jgi:hypothetical protein
MLNLATRKNKQRKSRPRGVVSVRQVGRSINAVPEVELAPRIRQVFRYIATAAGPQNIQSFYLFGAMVVQSGTTDTGVYSLIQAYRIKKIQMWAPAISATAVLDCQWLLSNDGNVGMKPQKKSCITMGTTENAVIISRPPKFSANAAWQTSTGASNTTDGVNFTLDYPTGTVIDLHLELVLTTTVAPFGPINGVTLTSLTPGVIYTYPLDVGAGTLQSVGLPNPPQET